MPRDPQERRERLSLWGLIHHLWESGSLNRWHPGWHRGWDLTRDMLRKAAHSTTVEGLSLRTRLYIPPVWSDAKRDQIRQHWADFLAPLAKHHRTSGEVASAFVVGTVRELQPVGGGHVLKLQHHSERFFLNQKLSQDLAHYSLRGWSAARRLETPMPNEARPLVVAALRVEASAAGNLTVVEAILMRVSPRYIPVHNSSEDQLARLLVDGQRRFIRPLAYDNHRLRLPAFVLDDVVWPGEGRRPCALFVYGERVPPAQRDQLEMRDRNWASANHLGYWKWDVSTQPQAPPFPPVASHLSPL